MAQPGRPRRRRRRAAAPGRRRGHRPAGRRPCRGHPARPARERPAGAAAGHRQGGGRGRRGGRRQLPAVGDLRVGGRRLRRRRPGHLRAAPPVDPLLLTGPRRGHRARDRPDPPGQRRPHLCGGVVPALPGPRPPSGRPGCRDQDPGRALRAAGSRAAGPVRGPGAARRPGPRGRHRGRAGRPLGRRVLPARQRRGAGRRRAAHHPAHPRPGLAQAPGAAARTGRPDHGAAELADSARRAAREALAAYDGIEAVAAGRAPAVPVGPAVQDGQDDRQEQTR
ncbi:hypothetical protein SFUMM280S_09119 [Streptomyces fumanus]